jgi:asparagine synthase (glutamine-hydrolysing)
VILSGDGGDELFAGYTSYRGMLFAEQYRRLPGWLGSQVLPALAQGVAAVMPAGRRYGALRAAKVLRDSRLPFETMYFSKSALINKDLLRQLFAGDWAARVERNGPPDYPCDVETVLRSDLPPVSKASYSDIRFRLLDDMLVKVDRMSMANSLEVRSPFLDHRLVEFAAGLPPALKLRGWETKAILRDTVRRYLPPRTMRKPKQGFSVPLREWLRTSLREMVGDYLDADNGSLPQGVFNRATIKKLLREHREGAVDHSTTIWLLLNYAAWHDLYVRGASGEGRGASVGSSSGTSH